MAIRRFVYAGMTALLVLAAPAVAQDASLPRVRWLGSVLPPLNFADRDDGILRRLFVLVADQTPGFSHEFVTAALPRLLRELEDDQTVCAFTLLRTPERERFALFGRPAAPFLTNRAITTAANLDRLAGSRDDRGALDLPRLLTRSDLRVGYQRGRVYGLGIDEIIAEAVRDHPARMIGYDLGASLDGLAAMLAHDRIQLFFGNAQQTRYVAATALPAGARFDGPVVSLPVAGVPPIFWTQIACNRSEAGQARIAATDRAIARLQDDQRFHAIPLDWLSDEEKAVIEAAWASPPRTL